ncbi:MAG: 30S ribosomal protein S14 [Candidatus Aenigmarchaeota archaeon]|nr:30S ribosomal protein S14 [Candidatus Aenigmarchaeota archaeon]
MSYIRNLHQIEGKPNKLSRYLRFNTAKKRKFGRSTHPCRRCGKTRGIVRTYGLLYCRQCFREEAERLGFRKYS